MDHKIKVVFDAIQIKKNGALWGKNNWKLTAKVDGKPVGDPKKKFEVVEGALIDLKDRDWSKVVKISGTKTVRIEFGAKESGFFKSKDFGSITHTLRWPFRQTLLLPLGNKYFSVWVKVLLSVRGKTTYHAPNEVFAARMHAGKLQATTVSGAPVRSRIEICEVRPLPPTAKLPKRLPVAGKVTFKSHKGIRIKSTDPINVLPNPPVIPVLTKANERTAARLEVTFYQPATLNFTDDDDRLEWKVKGSGRVKFLGKNKGLRVHLYGTREGEIKLQLYYQGAVAAEYRALVKKTKKVVLRVNILDGGRGYRAASGSKSIYGHIKIANRYLRQVGVRLSLDANKTTIRAGATSVTRLRRGIFRVKLPGSRRGDTRNVGGSNPRALRYNYRAKVLNIAYVKSMSSATTLGQVFARPRNTATVPTGKSFPQVTDRGSPSTSWIKPSGVWPDKNVKKQILELMNGKTDPAAPNLWGLAVPNGNKGWRQYGYTLAHEVGHMLGLAHRDATQDLLPESRVNVMHATNVPLRRQDLDIVQARAVHQSPMLT